MGAVRRRRECRREGDDMGLSPEEEAAFASIAFRLGERTQTLVSWLGVGVCVAVVGVVVGLSVLLGIPGELIALFCLAFVVALTAGLLLIVRSGRRARSR
jgi:uncharacterized Tic20 family protein